MTTVFPAATPLHVQQQGSRYYGPGVAETAHGVAAMLAVAARWSERALRTSLPFLFIGNVRKEARRRICAAWTVFATPRWRDAIAYSVIVDGAGTDAWWLRPWAAAASK